MLRLAVNHLSLVVLVKGYLSALVRSGNGIDIPSHNDHPSDRRTLPDGLDFEKGFMFHFSRFNSDLSELESVDSYQLTLDPEKWVSDKIVVQKTGNVVTVTLVNNIKNYTVNTYTILGTLPEKFRPRILEACFVYNINDGATTAYQLSVDPDGRVGHYGYGTQGTVINAGRSVLTYICNP